MNKDKGYLLTRVELLNSMYNMKHITPKRQIKMMLLALELWETGVRSQDISTDDNGDIR